MAQTPPRSRLAQGLILTTATTLVVAVVLIARTIDVRFGLSLPGVLQLPGVAAMTFGMALIGWAEATLLRTARSTGGFGDPPMLLVARGPYRHVRNPIYLGAFALLLGISLWRGSATLLAAALVFLPLMHLFLVRVEEPATRRRLGAAYDDYLNRVPRWLPRPTPTDDG